MKRTEMKLNEKEWLGFIQGNHVRKSTRNNFIVRPITQIHGRNLLVSSLSYICLGCIILDLNDDQDSMMDSEGLH